MIGAARVQKTDTNETDEMLMDYVSQGDAQAFQRLVNRHALKFRAVAYKYLGDMAAAEDMVQDSFIKVWTKPQAFDTAKSKFTTWFYRVVVNKCLDEKRKKKAVALPEDYDAIDDAPMADAKIEVRHETGRMHKAIKSLNDKQAQAITLCYLEEYSNKEAAEMMNMKVKALESLLVRARQKLKTVLGQSRT